MDQPTTTLPSSNVHPGSGRRKAPRFPKGRVLDDKDLEEIRTMLGDTPRDRDLLIEFLHLIQDKKGFLPAGLLHALAEEMRIPMSEVYETASFYAHFDILHDEQAPPPETTVRVCDSLSCMLKGSDTLISALEKSSPPSARIIRAPCMGRCDQAPVCEVGHLHGV
ncbi:MAG: NAD(P)H-dependent oxidoreductase subunit E [Rhodospirillales bacterium]